MDTLHKYNPKYEKSWALVVGVNAYTNAPPLNYACNDAAAVADSLIGKFDFAPDRVTRLLDEKATLENIRAAIAQLIRVTTEDDRVVIFYAGHGHTLRGNRRESGFLVPVGGRSDDTATLLPWDELVSNGNLLRAKHVLYIMDACYSGLISMRRLAPGNARIARDMLSRYSRQYVTAGKADEVVADGGGPRHGHSMFTGHLLDALDGAVELPDGIITANAVIAYVYDRVAKDPHSQQTPHYGWLEGDGDLFFTDPKVDPDPAKKEDRDNKLVVVPPDLEAPAEAIASQSFLGQTKEYLSDPRYRIRLHDLVMGELRTSQQHLGEDKFPLQGGQITKEEFPARLKRYEAAMENVLQIGVLLGRWVEKEQQTTIRQLVNVLASQIQSKSGLVVYLALRSYPLLLAMYATGIAALEGSNYQVLYTLFTTPIPDYRRGGPAKNALEMTVEAMLDVERSDAFKLLPNFEQKYAPRSEYLFTTIQPVIEDILFLGSRYEDLFDRFELLYALCYADLTDDYWGPPGRFGWKYNRLHGGKNPFVELVEEAKREGDQWAPVRAGLFRGSSQRFLEIAEHFKTRLLERLPWH